MMKNLTLTLNGYDEELFIIKKAQALFRSSVKLEINKGIASNKIANTPYYYGEIKCKKSECAVVYSGNHQDYVIIVVGGGYKLSKIFVHGWRTE